MPRLLYFPVGGRAESIRFLLMHAKVDFVDDRCDPHKHMAEKAEGKKF